MTQGYPPGPPSWTGQQQGYGPPPGPPPKKTNWALIIGLGFLGLAVVGFGSCAVCVAVVGSAAEKTTERAGEKHHRGGSKSTPTDPDMAGKMAAKFVPIDTLLGDYKKNEVRADELYRGKWIMTKGKVQQISKGIGDGVYIVLGGKGGSTLETVHCTPTESSAARAGQLQQGSIIQVSGKVDRYLLLSVMLDDCQF